MKAFLSKSISWLILGINPGQLNFFYKVVSKFPPFKKTIYVIVRSLIPSKVKLGNYELFLNQNDPMVSGAIGLNVYENYEIEVFTKLLKPEMIFVDVGANIGFYTLLAAGKVSSILAFEPDKTNFAILQKNIEHNHIKANLYNLALADKLGEIFLFENPENFGDRRIYQFDSSGAKVAVSAVNLDDFLETHNISKVDLIKIDIQGAEGLALQGMKKLLAQPSLQMIMEFFPAGLLASGFEPVTILNLLAENQFQIFDLDGRRRQMNQITEFATFTKKFKETDYTNLYCKK